MTMAVVDASVVGRSLFEDEQHPLSEQILDELEAGKLALLTPALWLLEITNALAMAERHGRIDPTSADQALEQVSRLPVELDPGATGPDTTAVPMPPISADGIRCDLSRLGATPRLAIGHPRWWYASGASGGWWSAFHWKVTVPE